MRIIATGVILLKRETTIIMAVGISENTIAFTTVALPPESIGMTEIPKTRLSVAPRNAPEDMPIVYGSASGFLKSFCIITPATASPAPTRMAAIALGVRTSQM